MANKKQDARAKSGKKKKGSLGGKLIKALLLVALFAGSGWWLFFSDSDSKARQICLDKLSFMVDRLDEASHAWEQRSSPAKEQGGKDVRPEKAAEVPKEKNQGSAVKTSAPEPTAKKGFSGPEASRDSGSEKEGQQKPAPAGEVSEKDKKELRSLLRKLQSE
ncbi:MAG: hypothetical protein R6V10_02680 [bacterium]